ncbi:hypothetical protein [Pseudomonas fluorescens]
MAANLLLLAGRDIKVLRAVGLLGGGRFITVDHPRTSKNAD